MKTFIYTFKKNCQFLHVCPHTKKTIKRHEKSHKIKKIKTKNISAAANINTITTQINVKI